MRRNVKRGECKMPGGKLVAVNVRVDDDVPVECALDGDFFVVGGNETQQTSFLKAIGDALIDGEELGSVFRTYSAIRLLGTDAKAIRTAYRRAVQGAKCDAPDAKNRSFRASNTKVKTFDAYETESPLTLFDWRERWQTLKPRVFIDEPRCAKDQMLLEERFAREVACGVRPATVRFWRWSRPAVVVGRFQSIADEVDQVQARRLGFDVVRRPTGGGAMLVEPERVITYSLYAPLDFVAGLSVAQSYRLCDAWLLAAFKQLGLDAHFSGLNDIASQRGKIGGSAQRRYPSRQSGGGAVLHHTMLDWDVHADIMTKVLKVSKEKLSDKAVRSSVKRVDALSRQTDRNQSTMIGSLFDFVSSSI